MAKLVWRVKLIAELEPAIVSESEVARIERDDLAVPESLGLTLEEGKRLTAATQAEMVRAQVSTIGRRLQWCEHCGAKLLSKGYYPAMFRSVFGDVDVRIRRLRACGCRAEEREPKSFAAMFATGGVAPELAYITAKFAALLPFARVGHLFAELLPVGGAVNAGTVRNRTMRVGATIARLPAADAPPLEPDAVTPAVIVGLDGSYVRSLHRRPERNFEVIAGKVIDASGAQHRFAFVRNSGATDDFARALVRAGVRSGTPSTVLSDGDAVCGTFSALCFLARLSCWTGSTLRCALSMSCALLPGSARAPSMLTWAPWPDATSSARSGVSGTAAGSVAS